MKFKIIRKNNQNRKKFKVSQSIFLDSDDSFYKKYTKKYNINFNLRPKNLALEKNQNYRCCFKFNKKIRKKKKFFDNVILLQTTSPFRKEKDVEEAYKQFVNSDLNSIVSVCNTSFKKQSNYFRKFKKKDHSKQNY